MTRQDRAERFRNDLVSGRPLDGVVVRTPSYQVVEVLAAEPSHAVDVVMFDCEHAAFGLSELDACIAIGVALGVPTLVRVAALDRTAIQQALDLGATGVVVPHVAGPDDARQAVHFAHYGDGGRGYSGSTRSAGWGTRSMARVIADAASSTTVIVQVEDVAALASVDAIAATPGVDAVFIGAADLAVALGASSLDDDRVSGACSDITDACRSANVPIAAFAGDHDSAGVWRTAGASLVFIGTDQSRVRSAYR